MNATDVDSCRLMETARRRLSLHAALVRWGVGLSPAEQAAVLLDVWAELCVGAEAQGATAFAAALSLIPHDLRTLKEEGPGR